MGKFKVKIPTAAIEFAAIVGWTGVPSDVQVQTLWSGRTVGGYAVDRIHVTLRGDGLAVKGVIYRVQRTHGEYLVADLPCKEDGSPLASPGIPMWRLTGWDHPGSLTWREILPEVSRAGFPGVRETLHELALGAGWAVAYVGDRRFEYQYDGPDRTDETIWELTKSGYRHFATMNGEDGGEVLAYQLDVAGSVTQPRFLSPWVRLKG